MILLVIGHSFVDRELPMDLISNRTSSFYFPLKWYLGSFVGISFTEVDFNPHPHECLSLLRFSSIKGLTSVSFISKGPHVKIFQYNTIVKFST